MYNYSTLFDSNYLTRGLAMYESLKRYTKDFHLYIFAFDDESFKILKSLSLENVTIISLEEFENEDLLKVKHTRSAGEYCWTCTPSTIKYCIENYSLDSCTYLDADLYFFADPSVLIEEMGDKSVLITPHRYTPEYDQSKTSGIYCVQFMTFKNDKNGIKVLNWWNDACIEWCYASWFHARFSKNKFGDQKYLDDWTTRFDGVQVLENLGGGVAPWNVQQYNLEDNDFKLIFYHFHALKIYYGDLVEFGLYKLNKSILQSIYKPYINHIIEKEKYLLSIGYHSCNFNKRKKIKKIYWKNILRNIKKKMIGIPKYYNLKDFIK